MSKEEIPPIDTDRLRLVSMSTKVLGLLVESKLEEAGRVGGFSVPSACSMLGKTWIPRRIQMIEKDPTGTDHETVQYVTEKRDHALAQGRAFPRSCTPTTTGAR